MKHTIAVLAASAALVAGAPRPPAHAQSARSLVNEGNGLYRDQKYTDAEVNYRKALEKESELVQGHFNLGNALHKQQKYDEATKSYQQALGRAREEETKAYAHYNIGNSLLREEKYREAADAYIRSLRIHPHDQDAKYNLSYALERLRQQQQQQQQRQQQQQKKDDTKQDDKKNQQQQNEQDRQQQQQRSPQQQRSISRADADRILEVLKNAERDVQKKLRQRPASRPRGEKDW